MAFDGRERRRHELDPHTQRLGEFGFERGQEADPLAVGCAVLEGRIGRDADQKGGAPLDLRDQAAIGVLGRGGG